MDSAFNDCHIAPTGILELLMSKHLFSRCEWNVNVPVMGQTFASVCVSMRTRADEREREREYSMQLKGIHNISSMQLSHVQPNVSSLF